VKLPYRRLGRTGIRLSAISLGSWQTFGAGMDMATARRCIGKALDRGINFFDTADSYAGGDAERAIGELLRDVPREQYVLATKCFFPTGAGANQRGLSRKHIFDACRASLKRLQTGYIDVLQCHRFDETTPIGETVAAMTDLIRAGDVLYWGVSQWPATAIAEAVAIAERHGLVKPVSDQVRYHLLDRAAEGSVFDVCRANGLGVLIYSPLAQGVLTGKYRGGAIPEGSRADDADALAGMRYLLEPEKLAAVERLRAVAERASIPLARLAIAWCLRDPLVVTAITGASSAEQIDDNLQAAGVALPPELLAEIDAATGAIR
jgi:voltage-dependent potassium channel beta subunit